MNQQQLKYARERAANILSRRLERITAKHTVPAITFTTAQIADALRGGDFEVIVPDREKYSYQSWNLSSFVRFPGERAAVVDQKAIDTDAADLKLEHERVVDLLVLGDTAEALALLRSFEEADV